MTKTLNPLFVIFLPLPLLFGALAVWAGEPRPNPADVRKRLVDPQATPETVALWKFTVTYLRDELKVRNLLYAFSPDCSFKTEELGVER